MKEPILQEIRNVTELTRERASKADLFYVICFWKSNLTTTFDFRCAYFEDVSEALRWKASVEKTYDEWGFKYYITSDISTCDTDCGFFEAFEEEQDG